MDQREKAALLWKNLSVYEPSRGCHLSLDQKEDKRILKGINGAINYRSLNAIMGPSGAGKTTLLKCLFGTSSIKYSGSIYVGDKSTRAVFITQNEEDHLLLNLTVEESIRFASKVKNNSSCRMIKKCFDADLVSNLIEQLDLVRCRHTLVNKCSGGQKKRLAIAQELASHTKPKIIFMDEPTSGIDSSVSYTVLKQLQTLSQRSGIAILCTIHQPSYKILELFDQLFILSRRGRAIYVGKPSFLRHHLLRYSLPCPDGHNPADVVIELASTETRKETDPTKGPSCFGFCARIIKRDTNHGKEIVSIVPNSEIQKIETLEKVAEIESEEIVESFLIPSMVQVKRLCSYQVPRSFCHIWFLFKRSFINSVCRETRWLIIRLMLHALVAFVLSFLYDERIGQSTSCMDLDLQISNCSCAIDRAGVVKSLKQDNFANKNVAFLFFNLMFLMFSSLMPTVLTFPVEMKVFLNEHRNGWYNTRSYYWAKSVVEFIVQLPLPYFYSLWMYLWTQQPGLDTIYDAIPFSTNSRFGQFVTITILSSFIAQGVGFLIGAVFAKNFNISIFVSTVFMMFNFLFSGFFIRIASMGDVEFLTKFSFTRFAFEAILIVIYGDNRCNDTYIHKMYAEGFNSDSINITAETATEYILKDTMTTMSVLDSDWTPVSMNSIPQIPYLSPASEALKSTTNDGSGYNRVISTALHQFDVDEGLYRKTLIWLIIHLIGWRMLTYVVLWWKVNPEPFHRKLFFIYFQLKKCPTKKFLVSLICFIFFFALILTLLILFLTF